MVFIVLSIVFSGISMMLGGARRYINIAAGIVVIVFGLHMLFNFLPFLNYEKRAVFKGKAAKPFGAFIFGMAFGAGWTPCIGPVLAGILFLAAQDGNVGRSVLYLAAYSLGLGLPFLAFALLGSRLQTLFTRVKKALPILHIVSGVLIIAVGVLILTGSLTVINRFFTPVL
jgi:cytochrome c-type biogenesis protein